MTGHHRNDQEQVEWKVENKIFEREGDDKTIDTDQVSHLAPGLGQITYLEIGG